MSNKRIIELFNQLKNEKEILMNFLKAKFPIFHNSNIFFRDFQYGTRSFLSKKGIKVSYQEAEELSRQLIDYFEKEGFFIKTSSQGWKINYPEFVTKNPGDPFYF